MTEYTNYALIYKLSIQDYQPTDLFTRANVTICIAKSSLDALVTGAAK